MARDAKKEKFWRGKMAEYEKKGLTAREFCAREELREVQFHYWRRALKDQAEKKAGFVELVSAVGKNVGAGVSIRIDDRISIMLERGFDGEALKAALSAVGEAGR